MALQTLIVAVLVSMCGAYATWTLMPAAARRSLARWLLGFNPPRRIAAPLAKVLAPSSQCGCSGCERAVPGAAADSAQPLRFHPRTKT